MKKNSFRTFSTGVFDRTGEDSISEQKFYGIIALSLARGFGLTAYFAHLGSQINFGVNLWIIAAIGFVISILGIILAIKSDNPILSFIGYNMVVIPFGFTMGPILNMYSPDVIRNAMGITGCITLGMGILGVSFPKLFSKLGWVLAISLGIYIIMLVLSFFIPRLNLEILDYIGAGIFSLYVGYDMYRATQLQKTVDNAIDLCVDFYLDIINLFLSILRLKGNE